MVKLWQLPLLFISLFAFFSCSAGNQTQQSNFPGYIQFAESNITLNVNETRSTTAFLMNAEKPISINNIPIFTSESGIVTLSPNICIFNAQSPPSCSFNITGVTPGNITIMVGWVIPGQPLTVTVIHR